MYIYAFTGVNEQNKAEVTWCLTTSASEKKVRYAAKSLFHKINTAQKGFLSKDEYKEAINKLTAGHEKERQLLLAAGWYIFVLLFFSFPVL